MTTEYGNIPQDMRRRALCENFLYREAELLDANRLRDWLALLTEDVTYRIPVRLTRERTNESAYSDRSYHMKDDFSSLSARVERLETQYDWSEDPPSRTRRFVTNVRANGIDSDEIECRSNVLLYRSRGDTTSGEFLTGERRDRLRSVDGEWKLARRRVLLDQTILNTHNLAIFL